MSNINSPIGVFDSGIGGLTVLKQLVRFLPAESYVYLGDTARVPYGNKSDTTVSQYAKDCTAFLLKKDVKLLVVACNSVSAVALAAVKELAAGIPVIGMIQPAALAAARATVNKNIGIIGTRATIQSKAYHSSIVKIMGKDKVNVHSQACPLLVPLVEEGLVSHPATQQIAAEYLDNLLKQNIDTLVLGCTHYPVLTGLIRNLMPDVMQIDSGEHAAVATLRLLADQQMLVAERETPLQKHNIEFYVTDYLNHFYALSQSLLGFKIDKPTLVELGLDN